MSRDFFDLTWQRDLDIAAAGDHHVAMNTTEVTMLVRLTDPPPVSVPDVKPDPESASDSVPASASDTDSASVLVSATAHHKPR